MGNQITRATQHVLDTDSLSEKLHESLNIDRIHDRISSSEQKLLSLGIENSYLKQRKSLSSDHIIETFFNEDLTDSSSLDKPAEVMDENEFNNNWKKREEDPDWKNGFLRPAKQPYMLEILDEFNLDGVGAVYKGGISRYDTSRDCYWLTTYSNSSLGATGVLVKLSPEMSKGKVNILGQWTLPATTNGAWYGVDVDIDNNRLLLVVSGNGISSDVSGLLVLDINDDGTLGLKHIPNGGVFTKPTNWGDIDGTSTYDWSAWEDVDVNYCANDVTIWDSGHYALIARDDASDPSPCKLQMVGNVLGSGQFSAPTISDITGFEYYFDGDNIYQISLIRSNNDLYIRMNDSITNIRFIWLFDISNDIVSNKPIKCSGRFNAGVDEGSAAGANEGITISKYGDVLEIINGTSYTPHIKKRALKNALWAENQVNGIIAHKSYDSTNWPIYVYSAMVEDNRYYWTADGVTTANQVNVVRYDTVTGNYKHAVLIGAAWTGLGCITTNGINLYLKGYDGTNHEVYFGTLSTFISAMEDNAWTAPGGAADIDVTSWGTLSSGIGATNTDGLVDIAYNSDDDILYILNDTDDSIDTLSMDGTTWTQGVYDLGTPLNNYYTGLEYKDGKLYVLDASNLGYPCIIRVLDIAKSTSSKGYFLHMYQDPRETWGSGGSEYLNARGLSFHGNDLVCTNYNSTVGGSTYFWKFKILEDPDVLQLHTFINAYNILLSNYVKCSTPIVERCFDPEDFIEYLPVDASGNYDPNSPDHYEWIASKRNVPDKNYMAVGYGDNGISILHLDEFLSDRSSTGKERYDVNKIRVQHYEHGANNAIYNASSDVTFIVIEKDMLFITDGSGVCHFIDLKIGKVTYLSNVTYSGQYYNGVLSERNDGNGATGVLNTELNISSNTQHKIYARTFTKDDQSDYNEENPKTFVLLGTAGGCDLLVIDWDENNNRTPVKVWNNLGNNSTISRFAGWIAHSGTVFLGNYSVQGEIYKYNKKVWDIKEDTGADITTIQSNTSYVMDISPSSRCWKTASGEWRHILITAHYESGANGERKLLLIDVENSGVAEVILNHDSGSSGGFTTCDNFEDMVFSIFHTPTTSSRLQINKKLYFDDNSATFIESEWTSFSDCRTDVNYSSILNVSSPRFCVSTVANQYIYSLRYAKEFGILAYPSGNDLGVQLHHLGHQINNSQHTSIKFDCNNPISVHYIKNSIEPSTSYILSTSTGNSDIAYTDGATATWVGTTTKIINRDGSTEGYLEWENITGVDFIGIHFLKDDDSGGAKVTITDVTTSTVLSDWDEAEIDLFHAEVGVADDLVCWALIPNSSHTYTVKVKHSGLDHSGASDYMRIKQFFTGREIDSNIDTKLTIYHTNYPSDTSEYTLTSGEVIDFEVNAYFNGDDSTTAFSLSGINHASDPIQFSKDGGATWLYPNSVQLTWGSNSPDYDNETVKTSTGYFTVKFDDPPVTGTNNVIVKYKPMFNKYYVTRTFEQPEDGSYIDTRTVVRLLDDAVEMIEV